MPIVLPTKAAAAIVLTEESPPRVLLARRSNALRFMGGYHVFPGGRIDESEPTDRVTGLLDPEEAVAVHAVARELFEETGLLLASGQLPAPEVQANARCAILAGEDSFDAFLVRHGLHIDATQFAPAGVWVTPAIAPVRFDTRYYLCRVPRAEGTVVYGDEIDGLDWLTPAEARTAWREGKIQLPPPVAYVLQNLAAYPFPEVWDHLRSSGEHTGERPAKMEFANGIYMLPLVSPTLPPATHTNCIIVGEHDLYLIDPGTHNDEELALLSRQVKMLEDLGGRVKAVLLTHSHIDHIGAAEYCRNTYNAPIWAHEATARQLSLAVDRTLADNELIEIAGTPNWRLRCIHTPGHDPGHLCFLEESTRTLIGGDIIANPGTIVVSLELAGDMSHFLDSLNRLLTDEFDSILPGHGMPMPNGKEKIRKQLEHRLWREEKVKQALATGVTTVEALLPLAYDDVPPETWPLAEHSLRAHLKRLLDSPPPQSP